MEPWFVYVLRCSDGSLYTGSTNDVSRRVREHLSGKASKYTRSRLPVTLAHAERVKDRGTALRREHEVKRLSRRAKLALCAGHGPR